MMTICCNVLRTAVDSAHSRHGRHRHDQHACPCRVHPPQRPLGRFWALRRCQMHHRTRPGFRIEVQTPTDRHRYACWPVQSIRDTMVGSRWEKPPAVRVPPPTFSQLDEVFHPRCETRSHLLQYCFAVLLRVASEYSLGDCGGVSGGDLAVCVVALSHCWILQCLRSLSRCSSFDMGVLMPVCLT
jgi:hypothetical protein